MVGMTKAKVAVTLPPDVLQQAREAVRSGRAPSLSAYVAEALAERCKLDALEELLDEMLAETGGPLTAKERQDADRALGPARPRRRRATA
jgi:Arc/MetJ-type ribon-helix-helix transcriptional regulator